VVELRYAADALAAPGAYTGVVSGWSPDTLAGPGFRLVTTVVVPAEVADTAVLLRQRAPVEPGQALRSFFAADSARPFEVRVSSGLGQRGLAYLHEPGGAPYREVSTRPLGVGADGPVYRVDARDALRGEYQAAASSAPGGRMTVTAVVVHAPVTIAAGGTQDIAHADLFNVTGRGAVYAARYNHGLAKWGDVEHKLIYGLDYRAYQNNVSPVGGVVNLVPDITVHPFSVTYVANLKREQSELSGFLSFVQNLPGMNDGTDDIFKKSRFQVGTAGYRLFRFGGSYSRAILGDWQGRIRLDAQYTEDSLVTGEQFAIGGADNVRGFNERFTSNDKGYRTSWEISSPDWAKQLGVANGRLRFLAFYDTGVTYRNQPQPGELDAASLDSVGLGLRFSYKTYFTTRFDVAHVLHDGTQGPQSLERDGKRNINKIHFSMGWVW